MFYEVAPEGKIDSLIYDFSDSLLPGQIVLVPLGKRKVPGIVIKKVAQPHFKTKTILKVLYSKPLPRHLVKIVTFIHEYYAVPFGSAVSLVLPQGVEKNRRKTEQMFGHWTKTKQNHARTQIPLNIAQKNALKALQEAPGATKLLYGVTGSGKTNIYLKLAENALKQQKSTILLVPEIALTSQLVRVFRNFFGNRIVLTHSRQTEAERHIVWEQLLNAAQPKIIIGPRSALFAPLDNLGVIIIDEEHESTYYQENSPHYSAVRTASFMAKIAKIPLILGSATPNIEDFYLASEHQALIKLTDRALTRATANIRVLDLKSNLVFSKNRYFSDDLLKSIADNLKRGYQTLIFHNRRGSAPLTICEHCGEEVLCPHCFLPLTLHADTYELICHTCSFHQKVPASCPNCGKSGSLIHKGFGTKLLENELGKLFKTARIRRFDADNKKSESLASIYEEVRAGEVDILIGTQTIAKGLDLPKLATVGIVQADAGLSLPDFAAEERTFQLITQVIGRVGRGHLEKAEVIIQTFQPNHPVLSFAIREDYLSAADYLLKKRKKAGLPPFTFIAKLEITMKTEKAVVQKVREAAAELEENPNFYVSPPMPAFHEHTDKGYTWQIFVRTKSRTALLEACQKLNPNFKITLDPPSSL